MPYQQPPPPPTAYMPQYNPPPGPPPDRHHDRNQHQEQYQPPPGPPPSHTAQQPAPYHDWTVVPDTSLLPPPPTLRHEASPTTNATESEANRAHRFCDSHPLSAPLRLTPEQRETIQAGAVKLVKPKEYIGDLLPAGAGSGRIGEWKVRSFHKCPDACLLTNLPLYAVLTDSPLVTGLRKTIYFELRVLGLDKDSEGAIALGYAAQPTPTWRLPGWERGSLGVHGDDGHRYVNDSYGGKDFTAPFGVGDVVGLGMTFSAISDPSKPPEYREVMGMGSHRDKIKVEVFFTRNGKREGGWDIDEERDRETDEDVEGLDGSRDLFGAVGMFGGVEAEVIFGEGGWMYNPAS